MVFCTSFVLCTKFIGSIGLQEMSESSDVIVSIHLILITSQSPIQICFSQIVIIFLKFIWFYISSDLLIWMQIVHFQRRGILCRDRFRQESSIYIQYGTSLGFGQFDAHNGLQLQLSKILRTNIYTITYLRLIRIIKISVN